MKGSVRVNDYGEYKICYSNRSVGQNIDKERLMGGRVILFGIF